MLAYIRKDLRENQEYPPVLNSAGLIEYLLDLNQVFECMQPEAWEDEEFNLLLIANDGEIYRGLSIDFEYK